MVDYFSCSSLRLLNIFLQQLRLWVILSSFLFSWPQSFSSSTLYVLGLHYSPIQFNSKSFKIDDDQVIYLPLHVNEPRSNDVHLHALSQMPPNVFFCFQYFSFPSVHFLPSTWYESLFLLQHVLLDLSCLIQRVENLAPGTGNTEF